MVKPEVLGNCRKGCKKIESVVNLLGACPKIPFSLLKSRHDAAVLMIANEVVERLKLGQKFNLQDMGKRLERRSGPLSIVLDQRTYIEGDQATKKTSRLPDIMVMNTKFKTIHVMEIAVSAEELIKDKFAEKMSKYASLCEHLKSKHPGYKVQNYAFVIGQLGIIQKDSDRNLKAFRKAIIRKKGTIKEGSTRSGRYQNLIAKILNIILKGSLKMYRWFRIG